MSVFAPLTRRDVAVATAFSVLGLALMVVNLGAEDVDAHSLAVPAFLAVTAPVAWRRAAPLAALAATLAALLVHVALFGELIRCGVLFPLTLVLIFAAAARLELTRALAGLGLALALFTTSSQAAPVLEGLAAAFAIAAGAMGLSVLALRGRLRDA